MKIPATRMTCNSVIVAQPGSGKSSLVAHLVEELIVRTHARALVIDPNGDFRKVDRVISEAEWTSHQYSPSERAGKIHYPALRSEFEAEWARSLGTDFKELSVLVGDWPKLELKHPVTALRIEPEFLSIELLAEGLQTKDRARIDQCHRFFQALSRAIRGEVRILRKAGRAFDPELLPDGDESPWPEVELVDMIEGIYANLPEGNKEGKKGQIRKDIERLTKEASEKLTAPAAGPEKGVSSPPLDESVDELVILPLTYDQAATAFRYFDGEDAQHYFGLLHAFDSSLQTLKSRLHDPREGRLEILDLPSLGSESLRALAVSAQLQLELKRAKTDWERAHRQPSAAGDQRLPRFIVVDEAHHLIPEGDASPAVAAVRKLFRTIAAEGRKYGLFLILASQRPDKLDHMVTSECENVAIMQLGSEAVLEATCRSLGLGQVQPQLSRCLHAGVSKCWLYGLWTEFSVRTMYAASRGTEEAGASLKDSWARRDAAG